MTDIQHSAIDDIDAQRRQARVELAAAYRLVDLNGWGESIFNHISLRVPGAPDQFYIKPHELTYSEVSASNLVTAPVVGDLDERSGVNRPGFVLHSAILRARPEIDCVLHLHTDPIVAVSALKRGLRMLSQYAARFHGQLGYHAYEGITDGLDEQPRIVAALGDKSALMLRHHGAVTLARSPAAAFSAMSWLVQACRIQMLIEAAGGEIEEIPEEICKRTAAQLAQHDTGRATAEWPALLRELDSKDSSYRH